MNQKKKYLNCFANEKTETIGKGRRKVIIFLCSLRKKEIYIYIYVYINVSGMWEVQVAVAWSSLDQILGPVWFRIKIVNSLYSTVSQWPV